MPAISQPVALRPEQPDDEPFLFDLYASTRQDELDAWGWPPAARQAFLALQFRASQGRHQEYPDAAFHIITLGGRNAGRLILHRTPNEWHLVDIALLPACRNAGVGTALLRGICADAAAAGLPLRLHVLQENRARRLYARLGFVPIGQADPHVTLEWRPADPQANPPASRCDSSR
jgi:ribosomal protein S18 acetylase RimI-like enzyme